MPLITNHHHLIIKIKLPRIKKVNIQAIIALIAKQLSIKVDRHITSPVPVTVELTGRAWQY